MTPWEQFCSALAHSTVIPSNLIPYVLAHAMLESGPGPNELANNANNFWSLGSCPEIYWAEQPPYSFVGTKFLKFKTVEDAVVGYWAFVHRNRYPQTDAHLADGRDFMAYLGPSFNPPGYQNAFLNSHAGKNYHEVICDVMLPQALAILATLGWQETPPQAAAPVEYLAGFGIAGNRVYFGGNPVLYKEAASDPNHLNYIKKDRDPGIIDTIVLHGTSSALGAQGLLDAWSSPNSGYSAHLIVGRDGTVYQAVPLNDIARHTFWTNATSIGIDIENLGRFWYTSASSYTRKSGSVEKSVPAADCLFAKDDQDTAFCMYQRYTQQQINTVATLCKLIKAKFGLKVIKSFSDIDKDNHWNTGPAFPLQQVVDFAFAAMPQDLTLDQRIARLEVEAKAYGWNVALPQDLTAEKRVACLEAEAKARGWVL